MDLDAYLSEISAAANLARELGVTPVLISQWRNRQRPVPLDRCIEIERATDGAVTCEELRPDLSEHWAYLRSTSPRESATGCIESPSSQEAA